MTEHYSPDDMREAISILLKHIDDLYGEGIDWRGQTPDWCVAAAMISCNIKDTNPKAITYLRTLL